MLSLLTLASYLDSGLYLYMRKYPHDAMCVNIERRRRSYVGVRLSHDGAYSTATVEPHYEDIPMTRKHFVGFPEFRVPVRLSCA